MKLKILIIEDESIVSLHIKQTILSLGYEVSPIAQSAKEAFDIAKNNTIDIIISDIKIKGDIDGVECCSILQSIYNLPVIFITAFKDLDTLKKASKIDFIGYLIKPFRVDELEALINLAILKYDIYSSQKRVTIDDKYSFCPNTNELFLNDTLITLTHKENIFLQLLVNTKNSIVTHNTIDINIWNDNSVDDNTRRQLVFRFKQKVPNFPFELVKGFGYRLCC